MEGPAIIEWATSTFSKVIVSVIAIFAQMVAYLDASDLILGAIAIYLACRFLLAPWISAQYNSGASDLVKGSKNVSPKKVSSKKGSK